MGGFTRSKFPAEFAIPACLIYVQAAFSGHLGADDRSEIGNPDASTWKLRRATAALDKSQRSFLEALSAAGTFHLSSTSQLATPMRVLFSFNRPDALDAPAMRTVWPDAVF